MSDQSKWSKDFNEFVTACLRVDVSERPTAVQLLQNKFILMGMKELWRLSRLVDDSVKEIESYRLMRANKNVKHTPYKKSDDEQEEGPKTMVSNHLSAAGYNSHDSINHSVGTVIDVGTLVIKQEQNETKQTKELDFVSYAKGMKMVEEMHD